MVSLLKATAGSPIRSGELQASLHSSTAQWGQGGRAVRTMAHRCRTFCLQLMRDAAGQGSGPHTVQALLLRPTVYSHREQPASSSEEPEWEGRGAPREGRGMGEVLGIREECCQKWGSCCTQLISLVLAMAELGLAVFQPLLQDLQNQIPGKNKWKPSSVHLGKLAGATKITENTKELLTRSFCEALWLLMWKSMHNSVPRQHGLCRGGISLWNAMVAREALMVWGEDTSAGT